MSPVRSNILCFFVSERKTKSEKSGLQFPVSRIQRHLRKGHYANHIGTASAVYLAGVLEYLAAELLELSGHAAKDNKRLRIAPRHLYLAIKNDSELSELLKGCHFAESGVMPQIHPVLLKKSTQLKNQSASSQAEYDGREGEYEEGEEGESEVDETDDEVDETTIPIGKGTGSQNY